MHGSQSKQAKKIPECNPNPLQEHSLNFKNFGVTSSRFLILCTDTNKERCTHWHKKRHSDCQG
jgi:hypothetical protein